MSIDLNEQIAGRLRLTEDGSLSNKRVEQYAMLRAEEVVSTTAAQIIALAAGSKKARPSSGYVRNIHNSPAFRARLKFLMDEKQALEDQGIWGQLEWQAKQIYRKGAAMDDPRLMVQGTDILLRVAQHHGKPKPKAPEAEGEESERGPGAPPVETPQEEGYTPGAAARDRLLTR